MEIAVGFDFDHTLGVDNRLERTVMLTMLAETAAQVGATYDTARAERDDDETLHTYRRGDVSVEDGVAAFFAGLLPGHETETIDASARFRERVVADAGTHVEPVAGALEMLAALDDLGIRYALLTNGWSPLQETKARKLGFRGGVFISERIGVRKPAAEAFDALVRHFDLPPAQIWFVGDDPEADVVGALAAGLPAIWFDWEQRTYPADAPRPTHVIHALGELPAFFQGRIGEAANPA